MITLRTTPAKVWAKDIAAGLFLVVFIIAAMSGLPIAADVFWALTAPQ